MMYSLKCAIRYHILCECKRGVSDTIKIMKWRKRAYLVFYIVASFLLSSAVYAQGLVPAGRDGNYNPDGYGICEFVGLVNNIFLFIIGLLALFAVIAFMYAGFMMVTSRGSAGQVEQAKGFFANVLIGAAIMFAAYLIVNTVLAILLSSVSGALGWQTVECSYAYDHGTADYSITLKAQYVNEFTPVVVGNMPTAAGGASASCNAAGLSVGDSCYAPNRCHVSVSGGACTAIRPYTSYIEQAASRYGVPADRIRGIMITESGGNPNARSPVGAVGLMQLMPGTAASMCGLSAAELTDPAKNIDCGARYYANNYRQFGSHDLAAAAYNGGSGANGASNSCPGLRKWQCPFDTGGCCPAGSITASSCAVNIGYQETRAYVDKVNAAAPLCSR